MQQNSAYGSSSTPEPEYEYELLDFNSQTNVSVNESLVVKKKAVVCTSQLKLAIVSMTVTLVVSVAAIVLTVIVVSSQGNSIQALVTKVNSSNVEIITLQQEIVNLGEEVNKLNTDSISALKDKFDLIQTGQFST